VMFTTGMQVVHLLQVAQDMHLHSAVLTSLTRMVIASIGPTTSEELQRHGLAADMEPSHPKMGFLVREAAERAGELLRAKRSSEYPDRWPEAVRPPGRDVLILSVSPQILLNR